MEEARAIYNSETLLLGPHSVPNVLMQFIHIPSLDISP